MIAEKGATKMGLASPEEVASDDEAAYKRPTNAAVGTGSAELSSSSSRPQQRRGGGGGWPHNQPKKQYQGNVLLRGVVSPNSGQSGGNVSRRGVLTAPFRRLPGLPMTAGLVAELKKIAQLAKEPQPKEVLYGNLKDNGC